jgi:hypothetical protein
MALSQIWTVADIYAGKLICGGEKMLLKNVFLNVGLGRLPPFPDVRRKRTWCIGECEIEPQKSKGCQAVALP